MDTLKKKLDILKEGDDGSINLLGENIMDAVLGGATQCGQGYAKDDAGQVQCMCNYVETTPRPSDGPIMIPVSDAPTNNC